MEITMPMILKNQRASLAFQFGRASALRSKSDLGRSTARTIAERAHRFNTAEKGREIAILLRELAEMRLELERPDRKRSLRPRAEPKHNDALR
jgi:hypothetical protein